MLESTPQDRDELNMNRSRLIGLCVLIAASVLLSPSTSVFANPSMTMPGAMAQQQPDFDWLEQTQQTLDDLKGKLDLKPEQLPAWDAWATAVMADAHQQLEKGTGAVGAMAPAQNMLNDETTPERMARGIAILRAQADWMQAHLVRLDAAQVRTKTFYETLDKEQKTIFDLFWTVIHHRANEQNDWPMPIHMPWSAVDDEPDDAGTP
jgi:hypothetical protein